jgi:hypothetical protein
MAYTGSGDSIPSTTVRVDFDRWSRCNVKRGQKLPNGVMGQPKGNQHKVWFGNDLAMFLSKRLPIVDGRTSSLSAIYSHTPGPPCDKFTHSTRVHRAKRAIGQLILLNGYRTISCTIACPSSMGNRWAMTAHPIFV